MVTPPSE